MATSRQVNWLGQMRVDTSDLRAIESGVTADFDVLAGKMLAGRRPLIVRGFTISTSNTSGNPADKLQLSVASGLLLHFGASEAGTIFSVNDSVVAETLASTNSKVRGGFVANSVNYVGLDLIRQEDDSTSDLRQFLDANTLEEVPMTVPTARTLDYRIIISTQPFSVTTNTCPVAKVETNANNNVVSVTDSRNLLFRLGSGGDAPNRFSSFIWSDSDRRENDQTFVPPTNSADPFAGGDKEILSLKQWMDALMSKVWELGGGEYWYSPTARDNVKIAYGQPVLPATGDNFQWISGTNTLTWASLKILFENSPVAYNNVQDGSAVMNADGQCLYVDLQRSTVVTVIPVVGNLTSLGAPATPGSRFIIAWRQDGVIHVRDRAYEVGRQQVVASTTNLGVVMLKYAAGVAGTPKVLAEDANGAISNTATANNATAIKGTGHGTGIGVEGVGGGTNGSGVKGTGVGTGIGVQGTGGTNGIGVRGTGTGTSAGVSAVSTGTGPALDVGAGNAKFTASNPTGSTAFANTLTPLNIPKAWVLFEMNGGNVITIHQSFNIASVTQPGGVGTTTLRITFASPFANTTYLASPSPVDPGTISSSIQPSADFLLVPQQVARNANYYEFAFRKLATGTGVSAGSVAYGGLQPPGNGQNVLVAMTFYGAQ
jgi:hypothetical protein